MCTMSRLLKLAGMAILAAAVVVALGAISPASAREAQAERAQFGARMAIAPHGGSGRGLCGEAGLEAAAEALGMTADEMSTQLWGGRTLADMADEAGVELQAVRDAVEAACEQATRDAIEQAVEDGRLTREQADWLLEGLDNGYWGGGFGHGFGFGRGRGFGRGGTFGSRGFGNFRAPSGGTSES
jgi:hypothetical protein